ncbi:MAG: YlbF family regulator [Oscillospiraceae bacterium]
MANANLIEMAKALGKALQTDDRYLAFRKAADANDNDKTLQDMIGKFNLLRLDLDNENSKEQPDTDRMAALQKQAQEIYGEIMQNPSMVAYQAVRAEFEQLLDSINRVIAMSAAGQDPDSYDPNAQSACSGNCSACGGCH